MLSARLDSNRYTESATRGVSERGDTHRIEQPEPRVVPAPPPGRGPRAWAQRAGGWIVPGRNPGGVVYGIIAIGALLAAESDAHETYPETVASAFIAALLYTLAYGYAGLLGRRLASRQRLTRQTLFTALGDEWSIVRGACLPLAVVLVGWATGATQHAAVSAAVWVAVGSVIVFELVAGVRSHDTPGELGLDVAVGITLGVGILGLKAVLG
jgi:hypothetical protein